MLFCSPLFISLSGVAAAILHISDVAFFAELAASSFMFVLQYAARSDIQNTVPQQLTVFSSSVSVSSLFRFFICFFPSISYMGRVTTTAVVISFSEWFFFFVTTGWISGYRLTREC